MPLSTKVLSKLSEISSMVKNKSSLNDKEVEKIKNIFKDMLQEGEKYDVDDVENWFNREGSWNDKKTVVRITNISHYTQTKHEQTRQFKILQDDDSCGCS